MEEGEALRGKGGRDAKERKTRAKGEGVETWTDEDDPEAVHPREPSLDERDRGARRRSLFGQDASETNDPRRGWRDRTWQPEVPMMAIERKSCCCRSTVHEPSDGTKTHHRRCGRRSDAKNKCARRHRRTSTGADRGGKKNVARHDQPWADGSEILCGTRYDCRSRGETTRSSALLEARRAEDRVKGTSIRARA